MPKCNPLKWNIMRYTLLANTKIGKILMEKAGHENPDTQSFVQGKWTLVPTEIYVVCTVHKN
jgi:hypothetical protein